MKIVQDEMDGIKVGCFGEKSKKKSVVGGQQSAVYFPLSILTFEKWYCCCEMRNEFIFCIFDQKDFPMITEQDINIVTKRIVEFYQPEKIILFGSFALGNANDNSDLDLLLIKDTDEAPINRAAGIRKALRDILLPMDILVYTPSEISKDKERKFTFIHDVLKSGKILYASK